MNSGEWILLLSSDSPLQWQHFKTFTLCALEYLYSKSNGTGFVKNDFVEKIRAAIKHRSDEILLQLYETLLPRRSVKKPRAAIGPRLSKSLIYRYLRQLDSAGFIKTYPALPRDRIKPTAIGIATAQAIYRILEFDPSIFETMLRNLSWEIIFSRSDPKLSRKVQEELYKVNARLQYEENFLRNAELVFKCVGDRKTFDRWLGKIDFLWLVSQVEINADVFDVEDVVVKTLGGVELELERSYMGLEDGVFTIRYTHPELADLLGYPVVKIYKIKAVLKKRSGHFLIKPHYPTRGFKVKLDYSGTNISRMLILNFLGGNPIIGSKPKEKKINVFVEETELISPPRGIAFVWGEK